MQSGAALSDGPAEVRDCAATRIASTLQLEVLVAVEDVEGVLHGVVGQRDGADGLRQADGLVQRALVDVAAGGVAHGAARVDLVVLILLLFPFICKRIQKAFLFL